MEDTVFHKIVRGELPCHKIYEDDSFLAFLDIFPMSEGHTLVIPKKYYRWVWDVENVGEYFVVCQKLAKHFQEVTGKEEVFSIILGEMVPYAHIHIIPDVAGKFISNMSDFIKDMHNSGKIQKLESENGEAIASKYKLS